MIRKYFFVFLFLCGMILTLVGCDKKNTTLSTTTTQTISEETTESDLTKQLKVIYGLAVEQAGFTGTYDEWLDTIKGPQGIPGLNGQEVLLQVSSGYIQWKYDNENTWTNLISLDSLRGETGVSGKEVLFRVDANYIQWQYLGDESWTNLISLSTLIGTDGREVIFRVESGYLQWSYFGEETWVNLIDLSTLIGPQGEQGLTGLDGKEIELRVNDSTLEWRYVNTDTWYYLYDLIVLKGEDATTPVITINEDGYWVIDGVVQSTKAYTTVQYLVTFNPDGGMMPDDYPLSMLVDKGNSVSLPIPEKLGYTFTGWITGYTVNDVKFNDYLPITKDTTLIATWEVDTSLISDYFDTVNHNHAFDYTLNLDLTNGTHDYYYDIHHYYYQNVTALEPYTYLENQTSINIPFMSAPTLSEQKYTQFDSELNQYVIIKNRVNHLSINKAYLVEAFDHYLGNLDPELFTMGSGTLLYDYQGSMNDFIAPFYDMLLSYGVDVQSTFDYMNENCVLNLLTHTLSYSAMGSFTTAEYGVLSFNLTVVYEFIEFDELTMVLPVDDLKQIITNQFNFAVDYQRTMGDIDYVYPESLTAFESLVLEKQTLLASLDNTLDLAYFYLNDLPSIVNYEFDIDTDQIYIDDLITSMNDALSYYTTLATQSSIDQMTVIFNNYADIIMNFSSADIYDDLGQGYYHDFISDIQAVYYQDIYKVFLSFYKVERSNELLYFSSLYELFASLEEYQAFMELIEGWVTTLNAQSTVELIDSTYADAIQSITSFSFTNSNNNGYLYLLTDDLVMNMTYIYSYLVINIDDYTAYINTIATDLYTQTDPYQWVLDAIELKQLANLYIINELKGDQLATIDSAKNGLIDLISSDDYLALQAEYDLLVSWLNQLLEVTDYLDLCDAFIENTTKIPYDPWVVSKNEALETIEENYLYLSTMATVESQADLLAIYNAFNLSIQALLEGDETGLAQLVNDTLNQLELSFIVSSEFEALYTAKEMYLDKFDSFYNQGVGFVDLTVQPLDDLDYYYLSYRTDMMNSMFVEDIIQYYHEGTATLAYLSYSYLDFSEIDTTYLILLNTYLNDWAFIYPDAIELIPSFTAEFEARLLDNFSPYTTIFEYYQYLDEIDMEILSIMRSSYETMLNSLYNDYYVVINPENYDELDLLYEQAWDAIFTETIWVNFESIVLNFDDQANILTTV